MDISPFREIAPHFESADRWNDVTINAGASQSTLQDIKLPECAGCYGYKSSANLNSLCSNRFIYWRIHHDVIELCEVSLDINLKSNNLRLRFQNTPILRGVSISEFNNHVVLLVPTVSAIFKLTFPHTNTIDLSRSDQSTLSVFHDTSSSTIRNRSCYHVLNHVSMGIPLPHTSCSWLDAAGNANFVMANSSGSVLLVTMLERNGVEIVTSELMKTGSILRLFNGITTALRGTKTEMAISIVCRPGVFDTYIFALFSDLQIRVWSHKKKECIFVDSILNYDLEDHLATGNFTIHQCSIRISEWKDELVLAVYVPVPHQKFFYLFYPLMDHDRFKMKFMYILKQSEHDLVDFCIGNSYIWSLWLSCDNEPIVLNAKLNNYDSGVEWKPVNLEETVPRTIDYSDSDPKEAYLKEIFKVGRFLPSSISKAITIYNPVVKTTSTKKSDDLRGRAIEAVEGEILLRSGGMTGDHEWVNIAADAWERFYSYCIQYQAVGTRPLGLSVISTTGLVVLLKKSCCSLLCTHDIISSIIVRNEWSSEEEKLAHEKLEVTLKRLKLVQKKINENVILRIGDRFHSQLSSPLSCLKDIMQLYKEDIHFMDSLQVGKLQSADLISGIELLLQNLDMDTSKGNKTKINEWGQMGGSLSGVGALCSGLSHFSRDRFTLCLHLLILELLLHDSNSVENDNVNQLMSQSAIIPRTLTLLRCYYMLMWCTQCESELVSDTTQEASFKQFCLLERPEFTSTSFDHLGPGRTIIHAFFHGKGGELARSLIPSECQEMAWDTLFPQLVSASASLLWPLGENVMFQEFLYANCQHKPLIEYAQLLSTWCSWSHQLLQFFQGASCILHGDERAALKLFLEVSKNLEPESLMCSRVLQGRQTSLKNAFYMRVIKMFEQFGYSNSIIKIATAAIANVKVSDSAIFHSVLFREYLNLGQWEQATAALTANPDSSRRKDCLRQLLLRLCQQKRYQDILHLSGLTFEEEVVTILESRARSSDLRHNTSFYKVLFSLHVHQQKYRRAAAVMYELAIRFSREVVSIGGLKKQADCLLATINCLHLADAKHAWIVKPLLQVSESEDLELSKTLKRNSEGEIVTPSNCPIKVDVLGLHEILKEYCLVEARLLHSQSFTDVNKRSSVAITPLTADETVALLLSAGLFEAAIRLSKVFSLSLVPVFDTLSHKFLSSSHQQNAKDDVLDKSLYAKGIPFQSSMFRIENLLEKLLFEHELPNKTDLHRCITEKILSYGQTIPVWLESSYQKRNFTELVYLYICHGLTSEATILMTKYVRAVMGIRKEDFGLQSTLGHLSPPVWLPYTYIDILLAYCEGELGSKEVYQDLVDVLDEYNNKLNATTKEMLRRQITFGII